MKHWRNIYKVARGVLFSVILSIAGLYLLLYILVSIPPFQSYLSGRIADELTNVLKAKVDIGRVEIFPFNEVVVHDVSLDDPNGEKVADIEIVGTRINLYNLIFHGRFEFGYAEVVGLDARLWQAKEGGPLNIQYIIDAFSPKDKNKPPTKYDVCLHSIILRRSKATFDKRWMPRNPDKRKIDFNHIAVYDLKGDAVMPVIKNGDIQLDLRRLSFKTPQGFYLETLKFTAHLTDTSLDVKDLHIQLPSTEIKPNDISLQFKDLKHIEDALLNGTHRIVLIDNKVNPSDFKAFVPALAKFKDVMHLNLDVKGNKNNVQISDLEIIDQSNTFNLNFKGNVNGLSDFRKASFDIRDFKLKVDGDKLYARTNGLEFLKEPIKGYVNRIGDIDILLKGRYDLAQNKGAFNLIARTGCGDITAEGDINRLVFGKNPIFDLNAKISADNFQLGRLTEMSDFGIADFSVDGNIVRANSIFDISVLADINRIDYRGMSLSDGHFELNKKGQSIAFNALISDPNLQFEGAASVMLARESSTYNLSADIRKFNLQAFSIIPDFNLNDVSGSVSADFAGNNIDNLTGNLDVTNLNILYNDGRSLIMDNLSLSSMAENGKKVMAVDCDWLNGYISGVFLPSALPNEVRNMLSLSLPSLVKPNHGPHVAANADFSFDVTGGKELCEFFDLPVKPLTSFPIQGSYQNDPGKLELKAEIPYIQQGKDKLIRDSRINLSVDASHKLASVDLHTIYPAKKGDCELDFKANAIDGTIMSSLGLNKTIKNRFTGELLFGVILDNDMDDGSKGITLDIQPSSFYISGEKWDIADACVNYSDKKITIDNLKVGHNDQYVEIEGVASASDEDVVTVNLNNISLDFVFETLAINYVTFGGNATGRVTGRKLLSSNPQASTDEYLNVKNLSYNGGVLGDGKIRSYWDNAEKEVVIKADISENGKRAAYVDGGVYVTRDSLSFALDADHVNIKFLQPFMSAFSSDVNGRASGKAKLYGTFSDIDLVGRLKADTISILLDYTNVYYSGSDSVIITPGKIEIPDFRLYDAYGNSAILTGKVTHRFFHEPAFEFRVRDMRHMLAYNTNERINPDWYGRIFASGGGVVKGNNELVSIDMDAVTDRNSTFTFVLNDRQAVEDYHFLNFSDRRKEAAEIVQDETPNFVKQFMKKVEQQQQQSKSIFVMNLQVRVTPAAELCLIMDPGGGDRITARGSGPIQFFYSSLNDDFRMSGKYVVDEGKYRFTLQDIIIKDFTINRGSSISFNGDPMNANLDINATYRVNTNLTDLDRSFATDRDLNRTNVPVDAILKVSGPLQSPEIGYDISLPTLTQDVERKVRSIISTDDMMSRQILYLLALNRFYTPDYTSGNSGNELASVASSTISSQLGNMMGQLTDKVSLSPSFRSDKGDFSDIEVDLGLSSRLFDNRLIINGNFGYRDKSTSSTTFIGDFDIEYLLNRSGNLRLKAYNHFNDQNYYLKSSLTTQGLGIVYRHDFNDMFSFIKRLRRKFNENKNKSVQKKAER